MLVFWLFCSYPFIHLSFNYEDLDRVMIKRDITYLFIFRFFHMDGKSVFRGPLGCMGAKSLKLFIFELRSHGMVVDNRLYFKDII